MEATDSQGVSAGCLGGVLIAALVLCAIPFVGGVVALAFGLWLPAWGGSRRRVALMHVTDESPASPEAAVSGELVTLQGRVTGPAAAVSTPLKATPVLATAWMDKELGDQLEDARPAWTLQLGDRVEIETEGARIEVHSDSIKLFTDNKKTTEQHDGTPPAHAPLTDEERKALAGQCIEYGEARLDVDAEVIVSGEVQAVDTVIAQEDVGYRGQGRVRRIILGAPSGGAVRISTYTPARTAELAREAYAEIIGGHIMLVLGIVSLAGWGWYFM